MKRWLWNKVGHDSCLCCVSLTLILWPYPSCRPSIMNRCCKTQFGMTRGRGGGRGFHWWQCIAFQSGSEAQTSLNLQNKREGEYCRYREIQKLRGHTICHRLWHVSLYGLIKLSFNLDGCVCFNVVMTKTMFAVNMFYKYVLFFDLQIIHFWILHTCIWSKCRFGHLEILL